jgi:hypothetical protein
MMAFDRKIDMNAKVCKIIFIISLWTFSVAAGETKTSTIEVDKADQTVQPCPLCDSNSLQTLAAATVVLPLMGWIAHNSFASFYVYKAGSYLPAADE